MIHYRIAHADLIAEVDRESSQWWAKAYADTRNAIRSRTHDTTRQYWSEIKWAFMRLQHYKCAYCEKPLAEGRKAAIDYDIEHHRPKSRCLPWPDAKTREHLAIDYDVATGRARGYPELAYHLHNYAVTCKVCNSPYKHDFFPILGKPDAKGYVPIALNQAEQPVVPMPLGEWGEDPGAFLDFEGFIVVPRASAPASRRRAEILIDFFELNRRTDLLVGRATTIALVYQFNEEVRQPSLAASSAEAQSWLDAALSDAAPYAGAARAFCGRYREDRTKARDIARLALKFVARKNVDLGASLLSRLPARTLSFDQLMQAVDATP